VIQVYDGVTLSHYYLNNHVRSSTAILVFTRTPGEEVHNKTFTEARSSGINLSISAHFINRTIREVKRSRIPYFIISSDKQHGNSFGERLSNAFSEVFALGFERVIAVGNDAPQLNASLLQSAAQSLIEKELVLGPDQRGGTYLIGISKSCFKTETLKQFSWNTTELFSDFICWSNNSSLDVEILAELTDVNTIADFNRLLRNKKIAISLLQQLQSIIASSIVSVVESSIQFYIPYCRYALARRGPPSF